MRVIEGDAFTAVCEGRGLTRRLDMMLVGQQPPGAWVLAFLDQARHVVEPEAVADINDALDALESILAGSPDVEQRLARLSDPVRPKP
jgi:hydrogenase expression/formation protein HypC